MERVTIGIASLGRPCLSRTLASLCAMEILPATPSMSWSPTTTAAGRRGRGFAAGEPWGLPVRGIAVGAGNISAARNACLEAATGGWMAFCR